MSHLMEILVKAGKVDQQTVEAVHKFIADNNTFSDAPSKDAVKSNKVRESIQHISSQIV